MAFWNLFLANLKMFYRNRTGFFWAIAMPALIYAVLSLLPVKRIVGDIGIDYKDFLLPGILAMTIMQTGIYTLAYRVVDMHSRGVLKRFSVTPVTKVQFLGGLILSVIAMTVLNAIVLSILATVFFRVDIIYGAANLLFILPFIILGGTIFMLVGVLISTYADTYEAAAPITAGIGLPLTFLSSIFYPVDILPGYLQTLAKILPMNYFAQGLRTLYLEPFQWSLIQTDIIVLACWFVLLSVVAVWQFRLED